MDFQQPPLEQFVLKWRLFLAFSLLIATYYLYNMVYVITSVSYSDERFQSHRDVNRIYEVCNNK